LAAVAWRMRSPWVVAKEIAAFGRIVTSSFWSVTILMVVVILGSSATSVGSTRLMTL
jgi:hypothetical protein